MNKVQKSRSVWIDEEGLGEIKKRMAELEKPEGQNRREKKCWTIDYLAEQAYVSLSTVKRLLNKKVPIDEGSAISILRALGFDPLDFIAKHDRKLQTSNQVPRLNTAIDWRLVCQQMLQEQQEEQRFRRRATEQGFEIRVYVPLGLVERKQQQRRDGIVPMEEVHQLEKEVIIRTYKHDEFLKDVIGQKSVTKNKHIAIVGEPGAGKTTLLDAIATHIQKNNEDLPICISLGSLQGKKLKDYILEEWLPEAIALTYPDIDVETFHETSLQKRLRQGGVWLLLDGVDEMGETSPAKALESIQNQLTDWLGNVRVVLTCRTNVWDASLNNRLISFDTYKTQQFNQADIRRFIKQWFGFAGKPELGKILRQKLNEPQRDRIRQLVENPLRLALLCQVFHKDKQAELPETKAGLYELFVRYFYEWKPTQCSVDWTTQPGLKEELHQALGRLSIAGLDSDARFRLPESLVQKEMGDRLFKLAWEIGWLNLVDRETTTDEPVYAFFHPTFQEYFAALAIDDWHFFLNHVPENPDRGTYRIFESHWKEVILLWLGRPKKEVSDQQKIASIESLVNFKDNCYDFYRYRAYFIASAAIAEFHNYSDAYNIVIQLIRLAFGEVKITNQEWKHFIYPITEGTKTALRQTDRTIVINQLSKLLQIIQGKNISARQDDLKQKFCFDDSRSLSLQFSTQLQLGIITIADFLLEICPKNEQAIDVLTGLLQGDKWASEHAAKVLLEHEPNNLEAKKLWSQGKRNRLNNIVQTIENIKSRLTNPDIRACENIKTLLHQLNISYENKNEDGFNVIATIERLGEIGKGDREALISLIYLLIHSNDLTICGQARESVKEILTENLFLLVVKELKPYLKILDYEYEIKNSFSYQYRFELIWHCAQNMSYPDFYHAWHNLPLTTAPKEVCDNIPASSSFIVQKLTLTQKIQIIQSTVASDPTFKDTVQLICIDGSQFSDQNNPAIDIYIEMVEQGCPEQQEEPNTMQEIKKYWRLRLKNLEKRVDLLFYNSKADREFSETCLTALSTFGGAIAIITTQPCENLQTISPSDPDLIDAVLKWLRRRLLED